MGKGAGFLVLAESFVLLEMPADPSFELLRDGLQLLLSQEYLVLQGWAFVIHFLRKVVWLLFLVILVV